jgi:hypothetical protein
MYLKGFSRCSCGEEEPREISASTVAGTADDVVTLISLTNYLHGGPSVFTSRQLCSYSKNSQHSMEPEILLLCSQEPATGSYPKPD